MERQLCDQCENQCPVDALQCGRGRRHFGLESGGESKEKQMHGQMHGGVIGQLRQCGHLLHHGGVNSGDPLSALSTQEQAELERLLGKLLTHWQGNADSTAPASPRGYHHDERK